MGITSSRTILQQPIPPRKSEIYPRSEFKHISPTDRLVCDELRKEIQCGFFDKKSKARYSLPFVQVPSKGLQQEDVRSILSMEENQVSRYGHNSRPTELF